MAATGLTEAPTSLAERRRSGVALRIEATLASGTPSGGRNIRQICPPEKLEDLFNLEEKLYDSGATGEVYRGTDKNSGSDVIIKMRAKEFSSGGETVWRSVLSRMLNLDPNAHVLGLQNVFEDERMYYIVMERCSGGELFDFLQTATDVPERECKRIMREILEAVDHIHNQGLIHRDIKPENIMFHDPSQSMTPSPGHKKTIKLIDFDTCQEYEPTSPKAKHVVGTMGYIAPEALLGEYSPASDLWSVGVILYILMTGDMPFQTHLFAEGPRDTRCGSSSMGKLYKQLQGYQVDFLCEPWPSFPQARDLCQRLLAFDPEVRSPSARDALRHPWLAGR
mmetsp:Transcript_34807/g.75901  ORF Transcript_34807/g.75901 Transcript_34807/m.75901 type:complete len:337 (+) Transcript_34807:85-1095(+)